MRNPKTFVFETGAHHVPSVNKWQPHNDTYKNNSMSTPFLCRLSDTPDQALSVHTKFYPVFGVGDRCDALGLIPDSPAWSNVNLHAPYDTLSIKKRRPTHG